MMMKLPDDIFRHVLSPYLTLLDLGRLDDMCMNHKCRPQVLNKIRGVILMGDGEGPCMSAFLISMVGTERHVCM
jgi:hypothetical protein